VTDQLAMLAFGATMAGAGVMLLVLAAWPTRRR
jgi:hypothetical protein